MRRRMLTVCFVISITMIYCIIFRFQHTAFEEEKAAPPRPTFKNTVPDAKDPVKAEKSREKEKRVEKEVKKQVKEKSDWLYDERYVERNDIVATDVLPNYFDTSTTDLTSQFVHYHNYTAAIMEQRRQRIKMLCRYKRFRLKTPRHFLYHFKEMQLSWCPGFKCGSTNWKQFFCKHYRPRSFKTFNNNDLKLYCPLETLQLFVNKDNIFKQSVDTSIKFLTVRHPYERLVSLYKEKLEDCNSDFYTDTLMMKILKRYRGIGNVSVLDRDAHLNRARDECFKLKEDRVIDPGNPYMNPMGVTFRELVQHITNEMLSQAYMDLHWVPMSRGCDLCITNYDVIEKFETLERDHFYLFMLLGKQNLYNDIAHSHYNNVGTTVHDLEKYFKTLDENLLYDLYMVYRDDFDLFNYKPHFVAKSRYFY